ncbi:exonuclease 1 [Sphingopyxis sp. 113P3]|nr:exonuclease 1 [Sphingopyxis sp. 113P3]
MRKIALVTTLFLSTALAAGAPAMAQDAPAAAASGPDLTPGTIVYDSEGAAIGPIASDAGDNVVVTLNEKPVTLPKNAFAKGEKGPAITITVAQLSAAIDQAAAANAQALEAALKPGAEVRSANGSAVLGTVKLADASGVVVTTPSGDVKVPKSAFFVGQSGLQSSFTAEQFAAAMQQASQASAADDAAVAAALTPGAEVRGLEGTAVLGTVKSFDAQNVVVTTESGDVALPRSAFNMGPSGLSAAYTAEQFAAAVAQVTGAEAPQTADAAPAEEGEPESRQAN